MIANNTMTFYGQEKVEYNAKLCLMNMAVHGLTGVIKSGDEANTFYHDAHNLNRLLRLCDGKSARLTWIRSSRSRRRVPGGCPLACPA